jgi:hypothetical protein
MSTCQVLARWPAAQPAERWVPRPDLAVAFKEIDAKPTWLPELPEPDAETLAAFDAWRHQGLDLKLDDRGISWPERVPFRVDHLGDVLAEFQVDRMGEWFEALGELDEAVAERLTGLTHVSPHVQYERARVVDNASLRFVEVTASTLVELSAVPNPGLPDTSLFVGNPGSRWVPESTVERFRRMESPNTERVAFLGRVEVA